MAGDAVDSLTFGTGASGLAPATIGYLNAGALMTAIQQRNQNAQNARNIELQLQEMSSRAQIAQDEMQLKRDEFNAEGPLREAQIENYKALANYHNRMGKAQSDAITKQWQYNASLVPQMGEFNSRVRDLADKYEVGSSDWWNGYNA